MQTKDSIYTPQDISNWVLHYGKTGTDINAQLSKKLILTVNNYQLCLYHNNHPSIPLTATDGHIAVAFEGELHNRAELNLDPRANDAELIVQLFQQLGEQVVEKIKGIYCLVIWDSRTETLFSVRDRSGLYPFFYCQHQDSLFVSTSLECVVNYSGIAKKVDRLQLAEHILDLWLEPERTYYQGVKRLPAANILTLRNGAITRQRYCYRIGEQFRWATDTEVAEFDHLLTQAVSRMLGQRRPGIFLSGGIDSVTVAALTSKLLGKQDFQPHALSLRFPNKDMDESFLQTGVADKLGFKLSMISFEESITPQNPLQAYLTMSRHWPVPIIGFWLPSFYYLALKGRAQGCEVILTGGGGDDWLGVGSSLAADLIKSFNFKGLYNFWQSINKSYSFSQLSNLKMMLWTFGCRMLFGQLFRQTLCGASPNLYRKFVRHRIKDIIPDWFGPDKRLRAELIEKIIETRVENTQLAAQIDSTYLYETYMYSFDNPVVSMDQEHMFEFSRRAGLKILQPFLDSDLVNLLYHTPPEVLNQNGYSKGLVRDMLAKNFPGLGFENQKKVISTDYYRTLISKAVPTMLKEIDKLEVLYDLEIIDKKQLGLYITSKEKNFKYLFHLRELINLETWSREIER